MAAQPVAYKKNLKKNLSMHKILQHDAKKRTETFL
jgi:hypothetical protein